MRLLAALFLAGCTFQTEALDGALGTSCGHYELSTLTTKQGHACWRQVANTGACFMSSQGACGQRATTWPPGTVLTQWCPIGNPGVEVSEVEPCD